MRRKLIGGVVVVAGAVALGLFAAAPARASDPISVAMALTSEAQHASPWEPAGFGSFRMTYRWPRGTMIGIADVDHKKYKFVLPDGTVGYSDESTTYLSDKTEGWVKMNMARFAASVPKSVRARIKKTRPKIDSSPRALPDRTVDGVRMGVYQLKTRVEGDNGRVYPGKIVTMTCLYDKSMRQIRSCASGRDYVVTYDHYDDPANDVTIPAAALHAREMTFPTVP